MSCRCELANSVSWKIPDFLFSGCIKVWFIFIISIYGLSTSVSAESPIAPTNVSVSPGYKELTVSWDWTGTGTCTDLSSGTSTNYGYNINYRKKDGDWREVHNVGYERSATNPAGNNKVNGAFEIYQGSAYENKKLIIGNYDYNYHDDGILNQGSELDLNTEYEVRVEAFSTNCSANRPYSPWSSTVSETTLSTDSTAPTVTISGIPEVTNSAVTATFTFSEDVTGFVDGDITLTNATASGFTGSGKSYSATITPTAEGSFSVGVNAGVANNSSNQGNIAATTRTGTYDSTPPTVTITGLEGIITDPVTATFTFSESVTGFEVGDITLSNARASDFTGSGATYTAKITPTNSGSYSVGVPADAAEDAAQNGNTEVNVTGTYSRRSGVTPPGPTVTITGIPAITKAAVTATFTFSESVTGFVAGDITLSNATVSNLNPNSGTTYTALITPTSEGVFSVGIGAGVAQNSSNVNNVAATTVYGRYDITRPSLTITGLQGTNYGTVTTIFTFSEDVTGFEQSDFTVQNGEVASFSGSGKSYRARITPTAAGIVRVIVPANVAMDAALNGNTAATASGNYDPTSPLALLQSPEMIASKAWITRFGRTIGQQKVRTVRTRISIIRPPGIQIQIAGETLGGGSGPDDNASGQSQVGLSDNTQYATQPGDAFQSQSSENERVIDQSTLIEGTSFDVMSQTESGSIRGIWGRGSMARFKAREQELTLEGDVATLSFGVDWGRNDQMVGLMLSHSSGTGNYSMDASEGKIKSDLTAFVPYGGMDLPNGMHVWGALGFGSGKLEVTPTDETTLKTDLDWRMAVAGIEGDLSTIDVLPNADLGWSLDGLWTKTSADEIEGLPYMEGETIRLRFGLSAKWEQVLEDGSLITPELEIGIRHDGGDAERGFGIEIGAGIGWMDPEKGLSGSLVGRTLVVHEDNDFRDWSVDFSLIYDPRPKTKRGFSAGLTHSAGSGGPQALLDSEILPEAEATGGSKKSWSAEMAYGTSQGEGMVGSSYVQTGDQESQTQLGYRIEPDEENAANMSIDFWVKPEIADTYDTAGTKLVWHW